MLRAVIMLAVAMAAASSVLAQTKDYPRRPVPFERKPVERVELKGQEQDQAQAPDRPHQAETSTRTTQACCR
jgi:hypothetical protein